MSAGGGDNMMGAIGTGNVQPGVVTVSLGTSGTVYAFADKPVIDPQGEIAAFCDSTDRWLPLACTMNVTVATEQVRRMFGWSHEELEKNVNAAPAGRGGLLFLPYLNGERTPNLPNGTRRPPRHEDGEHDAGASRPRDHGRRDARARLRPRAASANSAFSPRRSASPAAAARAPSGGRSPRIFSACRPICLASAEGAALGAALQAAYATLIATGKRTSLATIANRIIKLDPRTRAEPGKKEAQLYAGMLSRQTDLTRRLHAGAYL